MRDRLPLLLIPLIVVLLMMRDGRLLRAVQAFSPPGWKTFMQRFTLSADLFVLLSLAGLFWIIGGVRKKEALLRLGEWGCCSPMASRGVVGAVKTIIERRRPPLVDTFGHPVFIGPTLQIPFHSFPSAHTSSAFSVAAVVSTLFPRLRIPVFCWVGAVGLPGSFSMNILSPTWSQAASLVTGSPGSW